MNTMIVYLYDERTGERIGSLRLNADREIEADGDGRSLLRSPKYALDGRTIVRSADGPAWLRALSGWSNGYVTVGRI